MTTKRPTKGGIKPPNPEATEEEVLAAAEIGGERMPLPPPAPSDEEFDRENAEVAHTAATTVDPDPEAPAPDPEVDMDITTRLTIALEMLARKDSRSDRDDLAISRLTSALERMVTAQVEGADKMAKATRIANRPTNEQVPLISSFNLRGDKDFPRPTLRCQIFLPWPVEPELQTREELELMNLLIPGEFMVRKNDDTKIKIIIKATYRLDSNEVDKLMLHHDTAFNNDNHRMLLPMHNMLRQILAQKPSTRGLAAKVLTMDEEADMIQAGMLNDGSIPANKQVVSVGE